MAAPKKGGRKTAVTVQVGPTVYPAGTPEDEIDGEVTTPGVFDNGED